MASAALEWPKKTAARAYGSLARLRRRSILIYQKTHLIVAPIQSRTPGRAHFRGRHSAGRQLQLVPGLTAPRFRQGMACRRPLTRRGVEFRPSTPRASRDGYVSGVRGAASGDFFYDLGDFQAKSTCHTTYRTSLESSH